MGHSSTTLAAEPASLDVVHERLDAFDAGTGGAGTRFRSAVAEVVANIIEHADATSFSLRIEDDGGDLVAIVVDDGAAFSGDVAALAGSALTVPDDTETGRGLWMASRLADLAYRRTGTANEWTLRRRRDDGN